MSNHNQQVLLRELPSVDRLLQTPAAADMLEAYGRMLTVEGLRQSLESTRTAIIDGRATYVPMNAMLVQNAADWLTAFLAPTLKPVINATGVIVHTNLGRAPLSQAALQAIQDVGGSYSTLEYEVEGGERGSRAVHAEQLLQRITGAEAALVVNNNAAALLLMLCALGDGASGDGASGDRASGDGASGRRRELIIGRGQLVEIGGGFRIPDVMAQSGAKLVEVGTTNRTHLHDYEKAINDNTVAILVAHHSNYKIIGFTSEPPLAELAELAHKYQLPLLYDQGSGALLDTAVYGLDPEPTVVDGLQAGCDLVTFSGDKLLGGPQAGLLVGRSDFISLCKQHPLARAVRADKLCLAGLAATLTHYLTDQALVEIPVWRMISRPLVEITAEAEEWAVQLRERGVQALVVDGRSTVGGGSLPGTSLPTTLLAIEHEKVHELAARLRAEKLAVVGRIQDGRYLVDPRTILPEQVEKLLASLVHCVRFEG